MINNDKRKEPKRYRLSGISMKEIKAKYPDKVIDAYVENERLILVLDTCRIKFDERIPQSYNDIYGGIH
jgi:hypothetical protein|tara:strand:+ start:386 stop:592 length:207 start_codon:yes stop_codon:yes gene_type:complete